MIAEEFKKEIIKKLDNDFEKKLLEAALFNLKDVGNKLRFNNFSYSLRELSRHILERLAPDDDIRKCKWFTIYDSGNPKMITRGQRMKYAIQGGLSNEYVKDDLGIDTDFINKSVLASIDKLSKYTHINPETFDVEDKTVSELSSEVMEAFLLLFSTINECKELIINKLDEIVNEEVVSNLLYETINSIDCLATHYTIENFMIYEINLLNIDASNVYFQTSGDVNVRLQYGSDGDVRRDDGMIMEESFPFTGEFYGSIRDKMSSFTLETDTFEVNTDSHWGEDEDEFIEKCIEEDMKKAK